jgi:hypothetical protein
MSAELPHLSEIAQRLLEAVRERPRTNEAFVTDLALTQDQYEAAKAELLNAELVVGRRGRGGGLILSQETTVAPESQSEIERVATDSAVREVDREAGEVERKRRRIEEALYPAVAAWAERQGYDQVAIIGNLRGGGRWENPDVLAVDNVDLEWVIGSPYELTTFEVKLHFDAPSVYQAASYRRFSQFVYLACYESDRIIRSEGRLLSECAELGIGVLSMRTAGRGAAGIAVDELNVPRRQQPSSADVDSFLRSCSSVLTLENPHKAMVRKSVR